MRRPLPKEARMSIRRSVLVLALIGAASVEGVLDVQARTTADVPQSPQVKRPKLRKAVKYDMIGIDGTVEQKLELVKSLGFEGVEIDSPLEIDRAAVVAAAKKTGIVVHGVIDAEHWQKRFSDPDEKVRAHAVETLQHAIDDAYTYGATTVLVVPGKVTGKDTENYDQVWKRSHEEIAKMVPYAKAKGVRIAIEVVWNDFITKPEELARYVDEFGDPTVGAYFDCSNMVKYGVPDAEWIRKLGKRLLKFDFKGYSKAKGWVGIGEGDEDWPAILQALGEIGYDGWATAEVDSGGREHLADVKKRMDSILGS
jgi:L-ribulose-5-phosphate 3-epimerase